MQGEKYRGDWRNDTKHGYGECEYVSGDRYKGGYRFGRRAGTGVCWFATGDIYDGAWYDDKPHGQGKLTYANGDIFEGMFEAGCRADGEGRLIFSTGQIYTGNFIGDLPQGRGVCEFVNGDIYSGAWDAGVMSGEGEMTFSSGAIYRGSFAEGRRNGLGTMEDPVTGDVYEGEWRDDVRSGRGTMTYGEHVEINHIASGPLDVEQECSKIEGIPDSSLSSTRSIVSHTRDVYTGAWANDVRAGYGVLTLSNGVTYEGYFRGDRMHGRCRISYPSGCIYTGEYINGVHCGKGRLDYPNGDSYEGEFNPTLGIPHGAGVLTNGVLGYRYSGSFEDGVRSGQGTERVQGAVYVGRFASGKRNGRGTCEYDNGDIYRGEWRDGMRDGFGILEYSVSTTDIPINTSPRILRYEGAWKNDRKEGRGTQTYQNGDVYEGLFLLGLRHGVGTLRTADGETYSGDWKADKRDGVGSSLARPQIAINTQSSPAEALFLRNVQPSPSHSSPGQGSPFQSPRDLMGTIESRKLVSPADFTNYASTIRSNNKTLYGNTALFLSPNTGSNLGLNTHAGKTRIPIGTQTLYTPRPHSPAASLQRPSSSRNTSRTLSYYVEDTV